MTETEKIFDLKIHSFIKSPCKFPAITLFIKKTPNIATAETNSSLIDAANAI